jgi:hypothetical protein
MADEQSKKWKVDLSRRADKDKNDLPEKVQAQIFLLAQEMRTLGPIRRNWPNFSSLEGKGLPKDTFHCHVKKGKPTYVACWNIVSKKERKIEVFYVGTHANAPY